MATADNANEVRAVAIETSGRIGSVAVVAGGTVVEERTFPHGLKHAAGLLPLMDELIRLRGWAPRDVDHLYVSVGPGSFTGLRVAIALAKTLALATGVKLVAVPTLAALVRNLPADASHAVVVLDAKRDQIFTGRYERTGDRWVERESAHLDDLASTLARSPRPVYLIGEGLPYHEKFLPANRAGLVLTPPELWRARASEVAEIGASMAAAGRFTEADALLPLYVRLPEAQEKYEAEQRRAAGRISIG